jgi:hypothetical protein
MQIRDLWLIVDLLEMLRGGTWMLLMMTLSILIIGFLAIIVASLRVSGI